MPTRLFKLLCTMRDRFIWSLQPDTLIYTLNIMSVLIYTCGANKFAIITLLIILLCRCIFIEKSIEIKMIIGQITLNLIYELQLLDIEKFHVIIYSYWAYLLDLYVNNLDNISKTNFVVYRYVPDKIIIVALSHKTDHVSGLLYLALSFYFVLIKSIKLKELLRDDLKNTKISRYGKLRYVFVNSNVYIFYFMIGLVYERFVSMFTIITIFVCCVNEFKYEDMTSKHSFEISSKKFEQLSDSSKYLRDIKHVKSKTDYFESKMDYESKGSESHVTTLETDFLMSQIHILEKTMKIVFRGSCNFDNYVSGLNVLSAQYKNHINYKVHSGFYNCYLKFKNNTELINRTKSHIENMFDNNELELTITGHSLGGILSIFLFLDIYENMLVQNIKSVSNRIHIHIFGCPMIGNIEFANYASNILSKVKFHSIANVGDMVTCYPGSYYYKNILPITFIDDGVYYHEIRHEDRYAKKIYKFEHSSNLYYINIKKFHETS